MWIAPSSTSRSTLWTGASEISHSLCTDNSVVEESARLIFSRSTAGTAMQRVRQTRRSGVYRCFVRSWWYSRMNGCSCHESPWPSGPETLEVHFAIRRGVTGREQHPRLSLARPISSGVLAHALSVADRAVWTRRGLSYEVKLLRRPSCSRLGIHPPAMAAGLHCFASPCTGWVIVQQEAWHEMILLST
jgi:hypothetical protein